MSFLKNDIIYPIFILFFFLCSCQQQQENNTDNAETKSYDSLGASMTVVKSYIRKLDSALLKTSDLQALLVDSDSATRALMSRDKDVVRVHETENVPIIDTVPQNKESGVTVLIIKEANRILKEAKSAIDSSRKEIEIKKSKYNQGSIDREREITQEFQAQIKASEEIISEAQKEVEKLQKEIDKVSNEANRKN